MAILTTTDLGGEALYAQVDHDPTSVATDLPAGSLVRDSAGELWHKIDSGSTTGVRLVNQEWQVHEVGGNTSFVPWYSGLLVMADPSGGTLTITLPAHAGALSYPMTVVLVGAGVVLVVPATGEAINDDTDGVMLDQQHTAVTIMKAATDWRTIALFATTDPTPNIFLLETLRRLLTEIQRLRLQVDEIMGDSIEPEEIL